MGFHGGGWWGYISAGKERPKVTWALLRRVLAYARPYRTQIAGMLFLILINTGLTLLTPLILRTLIDQTIPAGDVGQLYTQEIVRRTKNGTTTSYNLSAVTRDGEKLDLLKGLDSPEAGLYIEQQIEQYYNITDQPVAGEMYR